MIDVITRVARERGTTYILMGTPPPRSAWQRLTKQALVFQILRALPGRRPADRRRPHPATGGASDDRARRSILAVALIAVSRAFALRERRRGNPKLTTASPTRVIFPFTGTGALTARRSTRRCASRASTARRSSRCSSRRCRCTCRSTPRCRASATARCRCSRRSSSAPRAPASRSTRGSSGAAASATRSASSSSTSPSTRSSSPRAMRRLAGTPPRGGQLAARARAGRDHRDPARTRRRARASQPAARLAATHSRARTPARPRFRATDGGAEPA